MEPTVVFHCTSPLIGIHLSFQVAVFLRFLAGLLVIVIIEFTALYLVNAWTCKKGIVFGIWTIAFFSFYIIPTLYRFVG